MSDAKHDHKRIAEQADVLIRKINEEHGLLDPAYFSIEQAINQFEDSGHDINELIPAGAGGSGLGFALLKDKGKGKAFLNKYLKLVMDDFCDPNNTLHKLSAVGTLITTYSLVTSLTSTLSLPSPFIAPIAAIVAVKGIDALCKSLGED
jgi:hypothetical protein